jgi:cell division protein FtsB
MFYLLIRVLIRIGIKECRIMMPADSQPFDLAKAKDLAKRLEAQQDKLIGLPEEFGEQFYTVWGYHAALAEIERLEAENKDLVKRLAYVKKILREKIKKQYKEIAAKDAQIKELEAENKRLHDSKISIIDVYEKEIAAQSAREAKP